MLEEAILERVQILVHLFSFLFSEGVIILGWFLLGLSLSHLEVLFTLEFSFKDGRHDFLLLRLKCLVVERSAQAHHRDCAICVTDSGHLALD